MAEVFTLTRSKKGNSWYQTELASLKEQKVAFFMDFLVIGLLPVLLLTIIEIWNRDGFFNYFIWFRASTKIWLLNYLLLFSTFALLYILPRRWFYGMSIFTATGFLFFGFVNKMVLQLKGDPLTPFDLLLAGEAGDIAKDFNLGRSIFFAIVVILVVSIITFFFLRCLKQRKLCLTPRLFIYLCGFTVLISGFYQWPTKVYSRFHVHNKNVNPLVNTTWNGFLLHFSLGIKEMRVEKPTPISNSEMLAKLQTFRSSVDAEQVARPNVIFWMAEAFWDLTESPVLEFSQDPLDFFHKMQKNHTSGKLLVKVRGGHTANTEFEILTGSTMNFLPESSVPYNQYLRAPVDSLARVFSQNGYYTSAIHPYNSWYYNRNKIYKLMGFHHYQSGEFFHKPKKIARRISDQSFAEAILATMQDSPKQDFIYAISMQNHAPYDRVEVHPDYRVSGEISETQANHMEKYVHNLQNTDQALKKLIAGIEKTGEPTVVVFFGDHMPSVKDAFQIPRNGLLKLFPNAEKAYQDYLLSYQTPLLIWNNFGYPKQDVSLSASYLGAHLLQMLPVNKEPFWDYLYQLSQKYPLLTTSEFYKQAGIQEAELTFYKQLQYNRLFGDQASVEAALDTQPGYFLGFKPQEISAVERIGKEGGNQLYRVRGQGFSDGGMHKNPTQIWVNDQVATVIRVAPEEIVFQVGLDVVVKEVQSKKFDNRERLIVTSNRFLVSEE